MRSEFFIEKNKDGRIETDSFTREFVASAAALIAQDEMIHKNDEIPTDVILDGIAKTYERRGCVYKFLMEREEAFDIFSQMIYHDLREEDEDASFYEEQLYNLLLKEATN